MVHVCSGLSAGGQVELLPGDPRLRVASYQPSQTSLVSSLVITSTQQQDTATYSCRVAGTTKVGH